MTFNEDDALNAAQDEVDATWEPTYDEAEASMDAATSTATQKETWVALRFIEDIRALRRVTWDAILKDMGLNHDL